MKRNASPAREAIRWVLRRVRLWYLARIDVARFSRTASFTAYDPGYEQVVARIMYSVHALEKGLARTDDGRPGFGREALANLNDALVVYLSQGYDTSAFGYVEGVAVIQRYLEHHRRLKVEPHVVTEVVDPLFLATSSDNDAAGTKVVKLADKSTNQIKNFYELSQGRSSVREFSGVPIESSKVMRALENAAKTPSVCNRQGWRVYWVDSPILAKQVLSHQGGFSYPQMPDVLLTITVSNNTFRDPLERNQGFIDGGLFAMSVLYGLEFEGLAGVPLNAMMSARNQKAVRALLRIDDSDVIAMFIGIGAFPDRTVVPVSDRKSAPSFIKYR